MKKSRKTTKGPRLDRKAMVVATFAEAEADDMRYWWSQSPQARLRAMELMRHINYGEAAAGRLQRVLEVVQSKAG